MGQCLKLLKVKIQFFEVLQLRVEFLDVSRLLNTQCWRYSIHQTNMAMIPEMVRSLSLKLLNTYHPNTKDNCSQFQITFPRRVAKYVRRLGTTFRITEVRCQLPYILPYLYRSEVRYFQCYL